MKKFLIKLLYSLILKEENEDISQEKRLKVFEIMDKSEDIRKLFRSLYTRIWRSLNVNWANPQDENAYLRGVHTGRLIELRYILDMMNEAEDNLKNLDKLQQRQNYFKSQQEKIKNYFTKKPI